MTSLAATLSVDSRGPSAIYIVTDSRITWASASVRWDAGQKTFASRETPDIFGYCGDAFFPPAILRQIVEQLDIGLTGATSSQDRHVFVYDALQAALRQKVDVPIGKFSVFHAARDNELMNSNFRLWETYYSADMDYWLDRELQLNPQRSYTAKIDGSGGGAVKRGNDAWLGTAAEGTSRACMWAFCDALAAGHDAASGGAPQFVGIQRKGPARVFGSFWKDRAYLAGAEVHPAADRSKIDWFNSDFERCDFSTGKRLKDAQAHPRP